MALLVRGAWMPAFLASCLLLALQVGGGAALPSPPIELPPIPGKIVKTAIGLAQNAGGLDNATFIFAEEDGPWAALVVNAGTEDGVDRVSLTYTSDTRTLTIEAEDAAPTNVVTILVNLEFVEALVAPPDGRLIVRISDAVTYQGLVASDDAGGEEVYVFVVTHFSVQTIRISPASLEPTLPDVYRLTLVGWAFVGIAALVVLLAAVAALRKRQ